MKFILSIATSIILTAVSALSATNETIEIGDHISKVLRLMGTPSGEIHSTSLTMLSYPRGKIQLRNNLVTQVNLISEEQLQARQEARKRQAQARRQQLESRRQQLTEQHSRGIKIRDTKLADETFRTASVGSQLNFWDSFRKQYPTVDIAHVYRELLARHQKELQVQQQLHQQAFAASQQAGAVNINSISMPVIDDVYTPDTYYPYPPQPPIIWFNNNQGCREPRPRPGKPNGNQQQITIQQLQQMMHKKESRRSYGTVHPDSPFGNSTIRAIRQHKNQTMRAFRHR